VCPGAVSASLLALHRRLEAAVRDTSADDPLGSWVR
jgi:hypothetical protein